VQAALDAAGIEYEIVHHPAFPRTARTAYIALTGHKTLPALELEDGTIIHRESKELVRMIETGELERERRSAGLR
jgi:glutathione S-transferase